MERERNKKLFKTEFKYMWVSINENGHKLVKRNMLWNAKIIKKKYVSKSYQNKN